MLHLAIFLLQPYGNMCKILYTANIPYGILTNSKNAFIYYKEVMKWKIPLPCCSDRRLNQRRQS